MFLTVQDVPSIHCVLPSYIYKVDGLHSFTLALSPQPINKAACLCPTSVHRTLSNYSPKKGKAVAKLWLFFETTKRKLKKSSFYFNRFKQPASFLQGASLSSPKAGAKVGTFLIPSKYFERKIPKKKLHLIYNY